MFRYLTNVVQIQEKPRRFMVNIYIIINMIYYNTCWIIRLRPWTVLLYNKINNYIYKANSSTHRLLGVVRILFIPIKIVHVKSIQNFKNYETDTRSVSIIFIYHPFSSYPQGFYGCITPPIFFHDNNLYVYCVPSLVEIAPGVM